VELDRLVNEDCIAGMKRLADGSVDLVFADPPFNIGYDYDVYQDRRSTEAYLDWTRQWGAEVIRVLKPHGTFWLAIGDEYAAELKLIFQKELGLTCRNWVIWYYTFGVHCQKKFTRSHAHLLYFVRNAKHFTFNDEAIRVPSARQLPRVAGTFKERAGWHGCQMPEQLLGRIIRACSDSGELVLDPFAGSGSTLVVAKKLGRRWLGFELSPDYAAQIHARLGKTHAGQPLKGAEEPKLSAPKTAEGKTRRRPRSGSMKLFESQ
jgi:site-specific DNA-methyltransferase (adenine-specific)